MRTSPLLALWLIFTSCIAQGEVINLVSNEKLAEIYIAAHLLRTIYQRAGVELTITPMPPGRATEVVQRGLKDGEVARIQAYADKYPNLIEVKPAYYYLISSAFAKTGSGIMIKSKSDLKNYRVGVIRGVAHAADVTAELSHVEQAIDSEQLFRLLAIGHIDIAIDTHINGTYQIKSLALTDIKLVGNFGRYDLFNLLVSDKKEVVPKISATIQALKKSGELNTLIQQYQAEFINSGVAP